MTRATDKRSLALALLPALAGCVADDAIDGMDGVVEPMLDGKNDALGGVEDRGDLAFGGETTEMFEEDFQFFGWSFEARENANITVEVTQAGSSRGLDTTLFVYRLSDDDEPDRIAFDDDDGFAKLSKIDDLRLFSEGRYAIVVGTKGAAGRGSFRLTLSCGSGECGPIAPPDTACPGAMRQAMAECLADVSAETGLEVGFHELIGEACATPDELEALQENVCAEQQAPFCDGSEAIEACEVFATASYPAPDRVGGLLVRTDNAAMNALEDAVHDSEHCGELGEDAGCQFTGSVFTHGAGDTIAVEELLAHARASLETGPGVAAEQTRPTDPTQTFATFMDFFGTRQAGDEMLESLGLDLSQATMATAFGEFQFAFGDCQADIMVLHFPHAATALELTVVSCFG